MSIFNRLSLFIFILISFASTSLAILPQPFCPNYSFDVSYASLGATSCTNISSNNGAYPEKSVTGPNISGTVNITTVNTGSAHRVTYTFTCQNVAGPVFSTLPIDVSSPSDPLCLAPQSGLEITTPQLSTASNVPLVLTHNAVAGVGSCEVVDNLGNILLNKSTPAPVSPYVINVSKAPGNYTFTSKCWSGLNGTGNEGLPDSVSYTVCPVGNIINSSGVCAAVSGGSGIPNPVANFTLSKYNVGQNETYSATLSSTGAASCEIKLGGTVIYPSTFNITNDSVTGLSQIMAISNY